MHSTCLPFCTYPDTRFPPNTQVTDSSATDRPPPTSIVTMLPPCTGPLLGLSTVMLCRMPTTSGCPVTPTSTPLLLTPTVTVPARSAGTAQVTFVDDAYSSTSTRARRPNKQLSSLPRIKCRPTTVTTMPASSLRPTVGVNDSTTACFSYMKRCPSDVKSSPPLKLTSTATIPLSVEAGVTHVTSVDESALDSCSAVCLLPNLHITGLKKFTPTTETISPPGKPCIDGTILRTDGVE